MSIEKSNSSMVPAWPVVLTLCERELVRFFRQKNRVFGALGQPIIFWLLFGAGLGAAKVDENKLDYSHFFPGTLVMILLFTAIFSTISIIEDRREGFLQSVLVAPVSRHAIVLGKVLGGTLLATGQGFLFLILAPLVGYHFTILTFILSVILMAVISFALTALGFCIAWRMSSTQGFHAIMNLFLMPMWFLSGALFPPQGAWWGLKWIMYLNPLTYGLAILRHFLNPAQHIAGPGLCISCLITLGFAAGLFLLAGLIARKTIAADLQ